LTSSLGYRVYQQQLLNFYSQTNDGQSRKVQGITKIPFNFLYEPLYIRLYLLANT